MCESVRPSPGTVTSSLGLLTTGVASTFFAEAPAAPLHENERRRRDREETNVGRVERGGTGRYLCWDHARA